MKRYQSKLMISLAIALIYLVTSCTTTLLEADDKVQPYETEERITALAVTPIVYSDEPEFPPSSSVNQDITHWKDSDEDQIAQRYQIQRYLGSGHSFSHEPELVIDNETYYPLIHLDIFSLKMYQDSVEPVDLLADEVLQVWSSRTISITQFPELLTALIQEPNATFFVNAVDSQNRVYFRTWQPSHDGSAIAISEALREEHYEIPFGPELGERLLITNRTGYPLTELYLVSLSESQTSFDNEMNLLGSFPLSSEKSVIVPIDKLSHIQTHIETFDPQVSIYGRDSDGDWYMHPWFPDIDSWNQELWNWDMVFEPFVGMNDTTYLRISNQSLSDFWYLYLTKTPSVEDHFELDDLLSNGILSSGYVVKIPLAHVPTQPLYLVGYDYEQNEYYYYWDPSEGLYITFDEDNIVPWE